MWTNRAFGNISKSNRMRAVCGGDFRSNGRPYFQVSFWRNSTNASFQRRLSFSDTVRKV